DYLNKIRAKENELISMQEIQHQTVIENGVGDKENIDPLFMNPHKAVVKGRPRKAGHRAKTVTNSISESTRKRGQYVCRFCKNLGHNISTCPHKT
ncbi:1102_t:CDS:1, partial [Ambispora leptoticha]